MKNTLDNYLLLQKWSRDMNGVFSRSDLKNLFGTGNPVLLSRRISSLIAGGAISRFKRGIYIAGQFSLEALSQKLYPESYISLGSALSRKLLIGSVPAKTVYAVKTGRNRRFNTRYGNLIYRGIAKHLIFGCEYEDGIRYATAEKAFLDTLYFYQKGFRFSFNVFQDIDLSGLNRAVTEDLLARYKNPKFISFVKGVLSGEHS
jgi:hypothetical protein